jgi:hypothetical protein
VADSHAYSSSWKILELTEEMSYHGKKNDAVIVWYSKMKNTKRQHYDFLRVNFSLGTDDSPSSPKSEAVKGGLVASGDGTAAA